MSADVSRETMPNISNVRVHSRRVNPITIGPGVQITIVICLTFIVLAIVGTIGGA